MAEMPRRFCLTKVAGQPAAVMRRKGQLWPAGIDLGWPHQVVLPARFSQRGSGYREIYEFCKDLSICTAEGTPSFTA